MADDTRDDVRIEHPNRKKASSKVTRLIVTGMTNREAADELMLSTKTVEFHLSHVYAKLGVRTRSELRARARANELSL